jgi:hypothetical protein
MIKKERKRRHGNDTVRFVQKTWVYVHVYGDGVRRRVPFYPPYLEGEGRVVRLPVHESLDLDWLDEFNHNTLHVSGSSINETVE